MPTVKIEAQISALDLLQASEQLSQPELEQFLDRVLQLRAKNIAPSLPTQESELLLKINQGLPEETIVKNRHCDCFTRTFAMTKKR